MFPLACYLNYHFQKQSDFLKQGHDFNACSFVIFRLDGVTCISHILLIAFPTFEEAVSSLFNFVSIIFTSKTMLVVAAYCECVLVNRDIVHCMFFLLKVG